MARVRQRKGEMVERFRSGSERRIEGTKGIELLMGAARFTGPTTLEMQLKEGNAREISAPTIFLNTGARASALDSEGLANVLALTSTTIMDVETVPEYLLIVGRGYSGVEFGQMFRRFGSQVAIIHRSK